MATDQVSMVFAALADPTRRAILTRLAAGEATVNELAAPFAISAQAVSKHLNVLARAGLISRTREAQWRRCTLDPAPLREIDRWIQQYRSLWADRHDALDAYLTELKEKS